MGIYRNMNRHEGEDVWRLRFFNIAVGIFTFICVLRLIHVQLVQREKFMALAEGQYLVTEHLTPQRGVIFDRCLRPLAMNIPTVSVAAYPNKIKDITATAHKLARILGKSPAYIIDRLHSSNNYVSLCKKVPRQVGLLIQSLGIEGIQCTYEMSRYYPKGSVGCQIVGFTDVDGRGLSGVELAYERTLAGLAGKAVKQKTALGNYDLFSHAGYLYEPPMDGANVVLTIDHVIQTIAHKELHRTMREASADSGVVIVMEPMTGEVLAMASEPSFNPNAAGHYSPSSWRLRAISDQFEPGSTLKLMSLAMLLNENLLKPDDRVFCENGKFNIMRETISDVHPYGWLSLRDVLVYSSNIGMAKSMMKQDRRLLYKYARSFGFGSKTGIELPGEISGTLPELSQWSGLTPLAMAFGHNIAVTPLQMANMLCTIANGGVLMKPYIIKEIRNSHNNVIQRMVPQAIHRVIKESTADTLKSMMYEVVLRGTGRRAQLPGIKVCGKTGTARMVKPKGGGYIKGQYVASFGGFLPMEKPQFVIFVMIDNPKTSYLGGDVAAPCFARIARQLVYQREFDIETEEGTAPDLKLVEDDQRIVPNVIGYSRKVAQELIRAVDLEAVLSGEEGIVVMQHPKAGTRVPTFSKVGLVCKQRSPADGTRTVPNVVGLPIRNALNVLASDNIQAIVNGSGRVVTQQPPPGRPLRPAEQVMLYCESSVDLHKLLIF